MTPGPAARSGESTGQSRSDGWTVPRRLAPGDMLGILGGGQLARMLALAARQHDVGVAVQDPDPNGPAAQVADVVLAAAWDDEVSALELGRRCQVVTVDNDHVPARILMALEQSTIVHPRATVLELVQDRLAQRRFIEALGLPQPAFLAVDSPETLRAAASALGPPCVLKARFGGYDGRGQSLIRHRHELELACSAPYLAASVMEAFVDYRCELSVIMARGVDGAVSCYPLAENVHVNGSLWMSHAPSQTAAHLQGEAERIALAIARALNHVGVLAVELFLTAAGKLLVNEVAPRTHNSGHFTLGACETSQFEQHLRAIAGWSLGSTRQHSSAAMLNLYGDVWSPDPPDWKLLSSDAGAHLHLYGKRNAWPGRKMGHVTFLTGDRSALPALAAARALCERLLRAKPSPMASSGGATSG